MKIKIQSHGFLSIFLFTMIIFPTLLFATEFPHFCRVSGLRFSEKSILLFSQHTAKPRMYLIHNISSHAVWLMHEKKYSSASAGWSSRLLPNHWSSVLVTNRNFDLQCYLQKKSGGMIAIPCERVIRACQFSEFYSKNPIGGGYWVVENVPFYLLLPHIGVRGFSLPGQKLDASYVNSMDNRK